MRVDDPYTKKARSEWYLARSIYKLEEIDKKCWLFNEDTQYVLDIGCAPGSRLQYIAKTLDARTKKLDTTCIIWFDLKPVDLVLPNVHAYQQDITDKQAVQNILDIYEIQQCDVIVSDMAPDTLGMADVDAIRSIALIEKTLWIYETYLKPWGTFAIKVFMWPGYDAFVREMKEIRGKKNIIIFKPKSCRKGSKEVYVIKRS